MTITSPASRLRRLTTDETVSGLVLLTAAVIAAVWANSPVGDAYRDLTSAVIGPSALHLDLSVSTWAADGLLAVFFLVVGLEIKHELVAGSLSDPREAAVPMLAAVGGVVVPALVYTAVVATQGTASELHGWAIPAATDIAFAVAVLMVAGRGLPLALRVFLLTLAVVDDLIAITVIAVFYTAEVDLLRLLGAAGAVAVFAVLARARTARWWLLVPVGLVAWWLMHESGVHATVAGVLLGLTVPASVPDDGTDSRAVRWAHGVQPWSNGIALPVFAFTAAGVHLADGLVDPLTSPVALGVVGGLLVGKVVGVLGTTALVTRLTPLRLPQGIGVRDLLGVGLLTGIGFTVALLIAELSFTNPDEVDAAKAAVLVASVLAAVLGAIALRLEARRARSDDMNEDGVPDGPLPRIGDA
ncbi:Na+/H+ antiporter NhaA [Aeromicrobium sp. Leaf350]|uniref:Na+/H+ antiporter NhaA n=1 Tax=Aeromicrobium sp. Leaf350 TaxID=2876565 RepID=UPI001E5F0313|nr:Na+/H+ antiporter NhaA [Aeromicrobium sp. Leaf350]